MSMSILQLIRATSFGICLYAGIYHLLVGMRRTPVDRIHLSFALTALAFATRNFGEIFFNAAASDGRLADYLFWGHLAVTGYILGLTFLTWFVTIYTKGKPVFIPLVITLAWLILLWIHQNSPYFYLFTEEPVFIDITLPWGEVVTYGDAQMSIWADMEWVLILAMVAFFIYATARQYFRGERREGMMLGLAVIIYMGCYINDLMLDYDMIKSLYILAQGFVVIIIMMSLTLSNEIIYTENELATLNLELDHRIEKRTKDLAVAKQRADAANRAKSVFLANMSHELRTPLNAILGHAQIMSRKASLHHDQQVAVKAISKSGNHLLTLINSVLEMSKIESGQAVLTPSSFTIDSLINDMKAMFDERVKQKDLVLAIKRDPNVTTTVKADRGKISQILINLLSNAVRHTSSGAVTLRVRSNGEFGGTFRLIFEVEDNGPGIAAEDLEKIFDPFVQTDHKDSRQTGTGLGLAISRQYAQLMNGDLTVDSHVGQGSIFCLQIPVVKAGSLSLEEESTPARRIVGIAGERRDFRVLVTDDDPANREVILGLLSPLGFEIQEAADGQEAIDLFVDWSPHLILMDIRMPVMDGLEAIQTIKSTEKGRSTPIIGVSASAFEEDRHKVLKSGADEFIAKPIREAELWEKIGQLLNVKFLYTEETPGPKKLHEPLANVAVTKENLAELPAEIFRAMQAAVQGGYMERQAELARSVSDTHPGLSQQLLEMVDKYDYKALSDLFLENPNEAGKRND